MHHPSLSQLHQPSVQGPLRARLLHHPQQQQQQHLRQQHLQQEEVWLQQRLPRAAVP
jgi:hypothetical protein